ncbi:MAG: dihydrolipoyl dehydrogenase [Phycisphaerales bacterium]|nr:dihydrolipoyl dehydrogenase [Phycisphaerales bacterium]
MVVGEFTQDTDLLVIGGGPGGHSAAFRAAKLGIQTTIVESRGPLGGVCLHCGCIPSKTLLSIAELIAAAEHGKEFGVSFGKPKIELDGVRGWKNGVVDKLAKGLDSVAKKLGIERVKGLARFEDNKHVAITGGDVPRIKFKRAIVATGSKPIVLKGIQIDSPRVWDSTSALTVEEVPKRLLVVGGGYIGLELGAVYATLGSEVTVVEMLDSLLPGCDADLVKPLAKRMEKLLHEICLKTRVVKMKDTGKTVEVDFEGESQPKEKQFDRVLVAVGRTPNTDGLGLERTGVKVERGFIQVDAQFRTADPKIFAIGDVIGNPMLAHKAIHEGHVCAEAIAGRNVLFDRRTIPAVVFTDPEIAWCGLTEAEAKSKGIKHEVRKMQWVASGRAVSIGRTDGLTKILFDPDSQRVLGVGITGAHAGEMIAEGALAIEMGAVATDLAETIHPHPTLSETVYEVAESMRH